MGPAEDADFTAFVLAAQHRLRRTAWLICGDHHRSQDIVQTAFARMYSRWAALSRNGDPYAYAHRVVVNAAVDEGRRAWRREHVTEAVPDRAAPAAGEIAAEVMAALAALPRGQRAVVVLRHIEDLDVETTAQVLGISPGTVKSQAAKGRATLRAKLSSEFGALR
jgi:RNA polymerase sigma-70 factor (sigma-E family)